MAPGRRQPLARRKDRGPVDRHRRAERSRLDFGASGLVAKPTAPKTKYQSYFEFVENTDKKKKLEVQPTSRKSPPPGYDFVPIGDPELTSACKEISRERDAMIFIVSNVKDAESMNLSHQVHRIGHHVRHVIVEEARKGLSRTAPATATVTDGLPEPIPESEEEYHQQVDAAIRDLFPRIPNTDRRQIIEHAFSRNRPPRSEARVGLSQEMTLARRVQLAVLAHIRHRHTRYDDLLKETSWQNARKTVEALCLDVLVKWRGDEETGRDQLDEILREVVVISDSDSEPDADFDDDNVELVYEAPSNAQRPHPIHSLPQHPPTNPSMDIAGPISGPGSTIPTRAADRRGFKRYQAWNDAIRRHQEDQHRPRHNAGPSNFEGYRQPTSPGNPSRPLGNELPPQRMLSSHPPTIDLTQENRVIERAAQQPVSPVVNDFQDLLVRSIEPASPDAPQSYYVRTLPPRTLEPIARLPLDSRPHHSARLPSLPPREYIPSYSNARGLEAVPHSQDTRPDHSARFSSGHVLVHDSPGGHVSAYHQAAHSRITEHMPRSPLEYGQHHTPGFQAPPKELVPAPLPRSHNALPLQPPSLGHGSHSYTNYIPVRDPNGLIPYAPPSGGRRVISDQFVGGPGANRSHLGPPAHHTDLPRNEYRMPPRDDIPQPFIPAPTRRLDTLDIPSSNRIVVDVPRPGERSNPILMEDRGGYFERVDVSSTMTSHTPIPSSRAGHTSWHEDDPMASGQHLRGAPAGLRHGFRLNG